MKHKLILIVIPILLISSCNELKRFRSAKVIEAGNLNEYVKVSLFSTKAEPDDAKKSSTKTLWDLQAEGQAAFIKKFADTSIDKDKLAESLNQEFLKEDAASLIDFTKKNVRIILSIAKNRDYSDQFKNYTPADRIEYFKMKLSLTPNADGYPKFIKWDKFETKFDTIKIADVSFERTIDTKVSAKAGNNNSKNSAGIDLDVSNKRTVAQSIKYRYVSMNGNLDPKFLQLEEEGNREIDLNDNIILDVTIEFEPIPDNFITFKNLFDAKSGKPNVADKTAMNIIYFNMPNYLDNTPLKADIDFDYLFRHVLNKKLKTFSENDDRVFLIKGIGQTKEIQLLSADEIKPKRWKIVVDDSGTFEALHAFSSSLAALDVQFSNYYEAADFVRWLKSYSTTASTDQLMISNVNFSIGNTTKTPLDKQYFNSHNLEIKMVPF